MSGNEGNWDGGGLAFKKKQWETGLSCLCVKMHKKKIQKNVGKQDERSMRYQTRIIRGQSKSLPNSPFSKKKYLEFNEKYQIWNVEWKTTKTEQIRRPALRFLMLALVDVKMERCWDKQRLGAEVRAARTEKQKQNYSTISDGWATILDKKTLAV